MSIMGDVEAVVIESGPMNSGEVAEALQQYERQQIHNALTQLRKAGRLARRADRAYLPAADLSPEDQRAAVRARVLEHLRAAEKPIKASTLGARARDIESDDLVPALTMLIREGRISRDADGFLSLPAEPPAAEPPDAPGEPRADEPVPDPVPPQARAEGAPAKGNGSPPAENDDEDPEDDEPNDTPVVRFFDESFDTLRDAVHEALAAGGTVPHVEDLELKLTTLERLQVLVAGDIADVLKAIADDLRALGRAA